MFRTRGRRPTKAAITPEELRWERAHCFTDSGSALGMRQDEAAELVDVSPQTWSRWENGKVGMSRDYLDWWRVQNETYRIYDVLPDGSTRLMAADDPRRIERQPFRAPRIEAGTEEIQGPVVRAGMRLGRPAEPGPITLPDAAELERDAMGGLS